MPAKVHVSNPNEPITIRAATEAALTATTADAGSVVGIGWAVLAAVHIKTTDIKTEHATNEIEIFVQTTYDDGASWVDVENMHLDNGDDNATLDRVVIISPPQSSAIARVVTDAALADDTKLDLPVGFAVRVGVKFLNTTSNPSVTFSAIARLF